MVVPVVGDEMTAVDVRTLVAVGVVAGDLTAPGIARYAQVHPALAERALADARQSGIISADGQVDEDVARDLVGSLTTRQVGEIHASAARSLLRMGPDFVADAVEHARAAGPMVPVAELLELADHAGWMSLSTSDYPSAEMLFRLGIELAATHSESIRIGRHRRHARALVGLGRDADARGVLIEGCDIAMQRNEIGQAVTTVMQMIFPVEWNHGDGVASALLARVGRMPLDPEMSVVVDAAKAASESWLPTETDGGQQLSWVSRASVAQPIAARALQASKSFGGDARLVPLLSWRATHRAPEHLSTRRRISGEALDLAQILKYSRLQVHCASMLAVDALESADRAKYDEALAIVRWVANRDGSPTLRWIDHTLFAAAAHIDGDRELAARLREDAADIARRFDTPGWKAADLVLIGQEVLARDDTAELSMLVTMIDEATLTHPLGRLTLASMQARIGEFADAERNLRLALRQHHPESSFLLVGTRAASVAVAIGNAELAQRMIDRLEPWAHHIAIDGQGLWCDGPVSLALAELHSSIGNEDRARLMVDFATTASRDLNIVSSVERVDALRARLGPGDGVMTSAQFGLTERQVVVLEALVAGRSNPAIAKELSFSVSTIRLETMQIFDKLGVSGRREAAAKAVELGLVESDQTSR